MRSTLERRQNLQFFARSRVTNCQRHIAIEREKKKPLEFRGAFSMGPLEGYEALSGLSSNRVRRGATEVAMEFPASLKMLLAPATTPLSQVWSMP